MRSLSDIVDPKPTGLSAFWAATFKWCRFAAAILAAILILVFVSVFVFALATGHDAKDSFWLAILATEYVAVSPLFLIATGHFPRIEI